MNLFSPFRHYISSTSAVRKNFPLLTIQDHYQIQYTFDITSHLRHTNDRLHEPSSDQQRADLPTLLILHGTLGGIDAARWHALGLSQYPSETVVDKPYQMLSISRPGYLSSQPSCQSFAHEAAILDQICEQLHLSKVAIMAVNGSGPTALTFVRDYPQRVTGLILMDAIAKHVSFSRLDSLLALNLVGRNLNSNAISYLWQRCWQPKQLVAFGFSGWDVVEEIHDEQSVQSMYRDAYLLTFAWGSARRAGFRAELDHLRRNLEERPKWKVHVPALYLYGGKDRWVTEEHVDCVMNAVLPGVPRRVVKFPRGKHLLPVRESSRHVNDFLQTHVFRT